MEASFRYIPTEIPTLAELGHYPIIEQISQLRRGLVLITGITGSRDQENPPPWHR